MANYVLLTFIGAEFVFMMSGILLLAVSILFRSGATGSGGISTVGSSILLQLAPLDVGIVNAIFIFITFLLAIPGAYFKDMRFWLKAHAWLLILCAILSMIAGLDIWFGTLQTRANLRVAWGELPQSTQSMLQQEFQCCGYLNPANPPFVTDATCTNLQTATKLGGCVTNFGNFANQFLDIVFTAMFGAVGLDIIVFLSTVVLIKDRAERERYQLIDRKYGSAAL